ncbi:MAG: molecular chaperone HtpG [Bacteroidales bacterium]|nr:molecular chaperone HtpG [Bacteroidales bacterium]
MQQKGNIGITTENIFPVIKKFLYSDHEIFLREIVANAVDATQKLKTLAAKGENVGQTDDLTVCVKVDAEAGTLTVSDRGIGMTADEIDRYINQIAFSGATDFLEKYKDDAATIIGHFGLGFYSTFMVAKQVDIITKSWQDAPAQKWSCDGNPEFTLEETEKAERGTDIVLHIDDDCKEFLEKYKVEELLKKYCKFLPVPIAFGKKTEWKDGAQVELDEWNIINTTDPLWTKAPSTLKDEDYLAFYRDLYPMQDDPLFWIHLNVDYPFNLTGVLYFPKIKSNIDIHRNKIQLFCNQVFVTDSVENIVPDFLTLLHGVIDSPDIPLNVSRSYLQSDRNVKKISQYITKKVADRLKQIFNNDRAQFEEKWDDLKLFIHYGILSEQDFYDKAKLFALLKDIDGKCYTYEEYQAAVKDNQTDKDGNLICLYSNDREAQYSYIEAAKAKGYNVLLLDGQLDAPLVSTLEQKWTPEPAKDDALENQPAFKGVRFVRVDGDTIDNLIQKADAKKNEVDELTSKSLTSIFNAVMPKVEKVDFHVQPSAMGEDAAPVVVTQSEYMRRMKEMSQLQPGMNFYGEMPDMYTLVVNTDHRLLRGVTADLDGALKEKLAPIDDQLRTLGVQSEAFELSHKDVKEADLSDDEKAERQQVRDAINVQNDAREAVLAEYARGNKVVSQLIDLALLQNGLLKGEALNAFVKRSVELI